MKDLCQDCALASYCVVFAERTNFLPKTHTIVVKCDDYKKDK